MLDISNANALPIEVAGLLEINASSSFIGATAYDLMLYARRAA